jgi:hemolysin activation/secretion protein
VQPDLEKRTVPTAPDTSGFPIPPVIERPLGVDEGPRIKVRAFAFEGVEDQPEHGVYRSEIETLAEKMRVAQDGQLSIGRLQEVANEITRYYRNAGFILAQAFIPEQTVQDDIVVIRVLEGRLDAVKVEGNELYSADILKLPFEGVIDKAVQKDQLESALLYITDYPGVNAFGVFKPGDEVGGTNLVLNVQQEDRFEWALSGDNYGIESTGEWRAIAEAHWNNVSGVGDRLSGAILQTFDPTDSLYGSLDYRRPIKGPKNNLGIGISRNDYDIGQQFSVLGVDGTTDKAYVNFHRSFIRSRNLNLYGLFEFNRQIAKVDQASLEAEDNLSVAVFELGFDSIDTRYSGINQGLIAYSHGFPDFLGSMDELGNGKSLRIDGDGNHAGGDFDKLYGRFARLQAITKNQSLLFRLEGQYTNDVLTSLEQMSIGGPNSVRAYPVNEYLYDKAFFGSVEWIINAPGFSDKPAFANRTWGEIFQVSLFYDYATGKLNNPTRYEEENTDDKTLHGVGGALQLNLPGQVYARLDVARRTSDLEPIGNDRDTQYWLTARYEF